MGIAEETEALWERIGTKVPNPYGLHLKQPTEADFPIGCHVRIIKGEALFVRNRTAFSVTGYLTEFGRLSLTIERLDKQPIEYRNFRVPVYQTQVMAGLCRRIGD